MDKSVRWICVFLHSGDNHLESRRTFQSSTSGVRTARVPRSKVIRVLEAN